MIAEREIELHQRLKREWYAALDTRMDLERSASEAKIAEAIAFARFRNHAAQVMS